MQTECAKNNIDFKLNIQDSIEPLINGYISKGTPMLRYIPENPYNIWAQLGECNKIVGDVKFAVVWMWVDKWAYRFIKNFGSCVLNACEVCQLDDVDILD